MRWKLIAYFIYFVVKQKNTTEGEDSWSTMDSDTASPFDTDKLKKDVEGKFFTRYSLFCFFFLFRVFLKMHRYDV